MNELPFRIWSELAPRLAPLGRDQHGLMRDILAPFADGTVFLRQKDDGGLVTGAVALWSGEARAFTAYLECPSKLPPHEPVGWSKHVAARIGDHVGDEHFLDGLSRRLLALAPYDPSRLPDFPKWCWNFDRGHSNLLIVDGRLTLPPNWTIGDGHLGPHFKPFRLIDGHGRMGLLALSGKVTVPCRYAYLGELDGQGGVSACEAHTTEIPLHEGQCDIIDERGKRTNPDGVKIVPGTLWFGTAVAFRENNRQGPLGRIRGDGRVIGEIRWRSIGQFWEGFAVVQDTSTKLFGYIDEKGDVTIKPSFEKAHAFDRGFAAVSPSGADGLFGLIEPTGKFVIPARWKEVRWFLGDNFHVTAPDGAIGLINNQGRTVIEPHHPSAEEQAQIEKSRNYIRGHPFTVLIGERLRERVEAALTGSTTLAPIEGMLASGGMKDIELSACGLSGRGVVLVDDYQSDLGIRIPAGDSGWIGFSYPASASIFNFSIEAPVEGLKAFSRGSIGIPWKLLRLLPEPKPTEENTQLGD